MELNSCERQDNALAYANDNNSSSLSTLLKFKDEPQDDNNCQNLDSNARDTFSFNMCAVKTEMKISNELDEDEADHMCLGARVKLLRSRDDSELNMSGNYELLKKSVPFATECSPIAKESVKSFSISRTRKRKKTAT